MFQLSDFNYTLPAELIAQQPLPKRSDSRLLVVEGTKLTHTRFCSLPELLKAGDRLIFNNTRVVPARIFGEKTSGGKLELMLERITPTGSVLAKIRCSKSPKPGSQIILKGRSDGQEASSFLTAQMLGRREDLFELQEVEGSACSLAKFIEDNGDIPLPPYIDRAPTKTDEQRYQTVYAKTPGAVAAPTAGLHFDDDLFSVLAEKGIDHSYITLHVGAGTFMPVRVDDPSQHVMHAERVQVPQHTVDAIERTKSAGGRIIAVGTTCVRSLEAAATADGVLRPFEGDTQLFLTPGSKFQVVDGIITNFHLPESTLLMLVAAFAGLQTTLNAYEQAVQEQYRFFSYGDAMLVWPQSDHSSETAA